MIKIKKYLTLLLLFVVVGLGFSLIKSEKVLAAPSGVSLTCSPGATSVDNIRVQISTNGTVPTGSKIISCRDGSALTTSTYSADTLRANFSCPGDVAVAGGPIGGGTPALPTGVLRYEVFCDDGPPPTLPRVGITDQAERITEKEVNCGGDLTATFPVGNIARGRVTCSTGDVTTDEPLNFLVTITCQGNGLTTDSAGPNTQEYICGGANRVPITSITISPIAAPPGTVGRCTPLALNVTSNASNPACGQNRLIKYISALVRFLTVGVGIVVVIMIVVGGIQYITSGGDPGAVAAAKSRIVNAIIALMLFIFAVTILNFLVPGGII